MKVKRTPLGYVEDDLDFAGAHVDAGSLTVHVDDRPTHSCVLGPDGLPLEYEDEPVGFRPR